MLFQSVTIALWSINWSVNISETPHAPLTLHLLLILWNRKSNCLHFSRKLKNIFIFQDLSSSSFITSKAGNNKMWCQVDHLSQVLVHVVTGPPMRHQPQRSRSRSGKNQMETFINDFCPDISEFPTFSQNWTEWRADIQQIPLWIKD